MPKVMISIPQQAPGFIVRGKGCHVWDLDGNEFIEYGMGLRAIALGHAFEPVVEAAQRQMQLGINFNRPSTLEVDLAEAVLDVIDGADMVKFAKNGSDVTTAAVKLARAFTGRDLGRHLRRSAFLLGRRLVHWQHRHERRHSRVRSQHDAEISLQ